MSRDRFYLVLFALIVQLVAFLLTFSRSAFVAIGITTIVYGVFSYIKRRKLFHVEQLATIFAATIISLLTTLSIFSISIANNIDSCNYMTKSLYERSIFNNIAIDIIDDKKYFGTGYSSMVLIMDNYTESVLEEWQYQPTHNVYLLIIVEIGLLQTGILIAILFIYLKNVYRQLIIVPRGTIINKINSLFSFSIIILLIIGCFDHYLWTIQQGMLIFGTVVVLSIIKIKN